MKKAHSSGGYMKSNYSNMNYGSYMPKSNAGYEKGTNPSGYSTSHSGYKKSSKSKSNMMYDY